MARPLPTADPAATWSRQLLRTKLYLPPAHANHVPRPRLLEQLTEGLAGPLTVISAPAGFGKTSLLTAWRSSPASAGYRLAWISLDPDDDEPARFLQYVTGALEEVMPGVFTQVSVLFSLPQLPPVKSVLAGIVNCLVEKCAANNARDAEQTVLAFDDYHVLENPAIHEAVEYLLEHLPSCLHLLILTRSDPPLRLARLRALGQLAEIRAADLRFNRDEITQFLNGVMRLGLPPDDVAVLDARTEGWIAGLKLAALRLAQPGLERQEAARFIQTFENNHRFVAEFLVEEVVSRQPPPVQEFLLRSSILDRLSAPLCDELLRAVDGHGPDAPWPAEETIEHLVRRNLFIVPLDEEGYWYRYHHLFRDLLRARLAKLQPMYPAELHRAASLWFEDQELLKEAVKHALLTKDWDYAADMVERHGVAVLGHSDMAMLRAWTTAFPEEVMSRRPVLCVLHAWVLILSYLSGSEPAIRLRLEQAEQAANALDDSIRAPLAPGKPPVPVRPWVLGNVIQLRAAHMLSPSFADFDPEVLMTLARQSMDLLAEAGDGVTDSVNFLNLSYAYLAMPDAQKAETALAEALKRTIEGHNFFGGVTAFYYRAFLAFAQGQLERVEAICEEGQAVLRSHVRDLEQNLPAIRSLDVARGCARLHRNDLIGADQALTHASNLSGWAPWVELTGFISLARLRGIQKDDQGRQKALAGLGRHGPEASNCARGLDLLQQLRTSPGSAETMASAAAWCNSIQPDLRRYVPLGIKPSQIVLAYHTYITWAHLLVMGGEARKALSFVEPALLVARDQGLLTRVVELSLVDALAHNVLGESRRSWEALERALAIAEQTGHIRTFDQGENLKCLLAEAAARGMRRRQIHEILDAIGRPAEPAAAMHQPEAAVSGSESARQPIEDEIVGVLSEREQEILALIAGGLSNSEIAAKLYISVGTVKTHVNHLFGKLSARNRTQLLARARMFNLLS